jgi:hypothetical protein
MKVCTQCLIEKDESLFYTSKTKLTPACKECIKKSAKSYRRRTGKVKYIYGKSRFQSLIGTVVNDWLVIGPDLVKSKRFKVLCRCKCGVEQLVLCDRLEKFKPKGCKSCHPIHGSNSHLFQGVGEIGITVLRAITAGAKSRDLFVNVTAQELWDLYLNQNKKCALSGQYIDFGKHIHNKLHKDQSRTASLDRIDSKLGYTIDNIQWVHKHINRMKNNYDNEYFKSICKLVASNEN